LAAVLASQTLQRKLFPIAMKTDRDEGQDGGPKVDRRKMTMADHASAIALQFPEVQHVSLDRLEKAVLTLPEGAEPADVTFRLDLWVDRGVPNVAVTHALHKNGGLVRQFSQLRNVALEASVDDKIVWHPKMMPLSARPSLGTKIETAAPPSQDADERLSEMSALAARFSMPGSSLNPDPVHQYDSSGYQVVDGGVFVFMEHTVRAVLVIEAFKNGDERGWQYKLNRLTSPPGSISFDGEEVRSWSGFWTSRRSEADEYVEQNIDNAPNGG
jgi:hypothetical protein